MREIKFRFWNKVLNHFVTPYDAIYRGVFHDPEFVVLQFTGLKDKNGKEIYEGDIVQKEGTYGYAGGKSRRKIVQWVLIQNRNGWNISVGNKSEVVGNIYENSNLLDKPDMKI